MSQAMPGHLLPQASARSHRSALVAAVQATPAFLDLAAGLARLTQWTERAVRAGAELVLFPEAFLPGYPFGWRLGADAALAAAWRAEGLPELARHAVAVPSPVTERLGDLARTHGIHLAVGVIERIGDGPRPRLTRSLLIFDPRGTLIGRQHHAPGTPYEGLLLEPEAPAGPAAEGPALPLARVYLPFHGMELYLAPTHEQGRHWQDTIRHIANVGNCFVVSSSPYLTGAALPPAWRRLARAWELPAPHHRGGSAIVSPYGGYLAGPLYDREGLLLARLHPLAVLASPWRFDPARINAEVVRRAAGDPTPGVPAADWPVAWRTSEAGAPRLAQERRVIAAMLDALLREERARA